MRILIHALVLTGPNKPDAQLNPAGASHLVFGPTDTGKSYIEECIAYCLGSDNRPRDVGYSEGYTRAALQVCSPDGSAFTFFRDLLEGREAVYEGFHSLPPQSSQSPAAEEIGSLITEWAGASDNKILIKSGTLGNVTASDLRRLSLFDEIRTLDKVSLEGKDPLFKMRNRAVVALAITGVDDSNATLAVKTDQRNIAKGHVQAIEDELKALQSEVPRGWTKDDCTQGLEKVEREIRDIGEFLDTNAEELAVLKSTQDELNGELTRVGADLAEVTEAKDRFVLLNKKYENDVHRLTSLITASEIAETFEPKPCPLCKTDLTHQLSHENYDESSILRRAAGAEINKINTLVKGLLIAISDITRDIEHLLDEESKLQREYNSNLQEQANLLRPVAPSFGSDNLERLAERRTEMSMAVRNIDRIAALSVRLEGMKTKAKRQRQAITRDLSASAEDLRLRVSGLLETWGVPMVRSVNFDEESADIHINARNRVSFGKGKRGIFLTALVVAMMERALEQNNPHLGLLVVDSPVVTYKDPKHGSDDEDEALDPAVKDNFYAWLADRKGPGQIIVLENEEPSAGVQARLAHTEFVGVGEAEGRRGFFPS